jgi:Holliday junction resolvase
MSNKSTGTEFEKEFCVLLSERGFWAHRMQDNVNGQPFDVMAAKNGKPYVFDCKNCEGENFLFRRMEENQRTAMDLWLDCGNQNCFFAVRYPLKGIRLFEYIDLIAYEKEGMKFISQKTADSYGYTINEFMREFT